MPAKPRISVSLSRQEYQDLSVLAEKHRISLAWLGDPIPSLTSLRAQYIGSESLGNRDNPSDGALPASVQTVVEQLAAEDTPKSRVLRRYFIDMAAAIGDVPISVQYSRMYASGGQIESLITTIAYPVT